MNNNLRNVTVTGIGIALFVVLTLCLQEIKARTPVTSVVGGAPASFQCFNVIYYLFLLKSCFPPHKTAPNVIVRIIVLWVFGKVLTVTLPCCILLPTNGMCRHLPCK